MAIKDDFKRGFESGGATANVLEGETASKFFTERVPAKLDLEQVKRIVDNLSEAVEENRRVKVYAEFDSPGDDVKTLCAGDLILGTADNVDDIELLAKWLRHIVS